MQNIEEARDPAMVHGETRYSHYKDAVLDRLSDVANVAQFVSLDPSAKQRYARVHGYAPNHLFESIETAISALLERAPDSTVNVRSFTPENPKSREFIYALNNVHDVVAAVRRLASDGLYTIINETVNVNDGGISGVAIGNILEFAPGDTPRSVEKPGTVSLWRKMGLLLLEKVYRFAPALDFMPSLRVEFSIHPLKRGFRHEHTIIWELEDVGLVNLQADVRWPNRFSRLIGDKAFGLLIADTLNLPVPRTTVISRAIAPFSFGRSTESGEIWIRTCPAEQVPGRYTTQRGWRDPFKLLTEEDPDGTVLASVLAQEGIDASYSGALITGQDGSMIIEGTKGRGDTFMIGHAAPGELPDEISLSVKKIYEQAVTELGPVRFEWVHDGQQTWVVQLHRGATTTSGRTIYPGEIEAYQRFDVARGIEALRALISTIDATREGIILVGEVGVTSHFGDLLRRAKIVSQLETPAT